jgi:hypothetical protein
MPEAALPPELVAAALEQAGVPAPAVPEPQPEALGELFRTYNPQGAAGGLFAPPHIAGYQPSQDAVAAWTKANRSMTWEDLESTRMPQAWRPSSGRSGGDGVYGPGMPLDMSFTDKRGTVDPLALKVLAQGGKYDLEARRRAIAERLLQNQYMSGG